MKKLFFLFIIFCALKASAQDYLISFAGSGATTTVNTVKVENLTAGTSLTINGSDILHLTAIITGVNSIENRQSSELKIYPNPMTDYSILEISPSVAGNAVISILDITGKKVVQIQSYLENLKQSFRLSGLKSGFYLINVKGDNYQFSGKLLSDGKSNGTISIDKVNNIAQEVKEKTERADSKGVQATVDMAYTSGDRLKFTGTSGIYSTVITDIPATDKTITFNFIACTDGDNNNYPVVEIGTQVWMEENLKTTKYNDGTAIPNITDNTAWEALTTGAYSDYINTPANSTIYGRLYNWYAVDNNGATKVASNGGKNVCPTSWHVPTETEWTTLISYLGGESVAGGKLKETGTTHWLSPNTGATNETGFTALPGGYREQVGPFIDIGSYGYGWSSTENLGPAWSSTMYYGNSYVIGQNDNKPYGFSVRCVQGVVLPELTTTEASSITKTSAICGGNVTNDGGDVTVHGVCWNTSGNPTIADNHTLDGTGTGIFTSNLIGLMINTKYYVKAFATNGGGTSYGNEIFFATRGETGTVSDIDGNTYSTIEIGTQVWMAENLKTTSYLNGDLIGTTNPATLDISSESTPKYQWAYDGNESNVAAYGRLYTWNAVTDSRNVCPTSWHVPTETDWTTLISYLGGESVAGGKLKEAGTTHWLSPNTGATNETGFTALPGGYREQVGPFTDIGSYGCWWSASGEYDWTGLFRFMDCDHSDFNGDGYDAGRVGYSVRCLQGVVLPELTTTEVSSITQTSAISGGNVPSDGGETVTARGVCWNTSGNPTIADNHTLDGTGTGIFTSNLTGLTPNTKYYLRAYATNSAGSSYGDEIFIATRGETGTVSDIDGNTYSTIEIGTQVWMAENLKTTSYLNGDLIGTTNPATLDISSESTPKYQWAYDGNESNVAAYGRLYTWYAVTDSRNVCPTGWHVPTDAEWSTLSTWLGGDVDGGKLKETDTTHWTGPNIGATNETGFTALPGGYRGNNGAYSGIGGNGSWWSSTEYSTANAWSRYMLYDLADLGRTNTSKRSGYSVRCVRD